MNFRVGQKKMRVLPKYFSKYGLLLALICLLGLGSCRSSVMPCPKLSSGGKSSGLFSGDHTTLKYDRKGRVKK